MDVRRPATGVQLGGEPVMRIVRMVAIVAALGLVVGACQLAPSAAPASQPPGGGGTASSCDTSTKVKVGFSAPAADHGWLGAVIKFADAEAAKHSADMEYVSANGGTDADQQANN